MRFRGLERDEEGESISIRGKVHTIDSGTEEGSLKGQQFTDRERQISICLWAGEGRKLLVAMYDFFILVLTGTDN